MQFTGKACGSAPDLSIQNDASACAQLADVDAHGGFRCGRVLRRVACGHDLHIAGGHARQAGFIVKIRTKAYAPQLWVAETLGDDAVVHRSGKAEHHRRKLRVTRPNTHQKRVEKFAHIAGAGLLLLFERCAVEAAHKPVQLGLLQPQTQEQPVLRVQLVLHGAASAGGCRCADFSRFSALDHLVHNAADRRKAEMRQTRKVVLASGAVLHRLPEQGRVLALEFACVCHGAPLFKRLFNSVLITIFSIVSADGSVNAELVIRN